VNADLQMQRKQLEEKLMAIRTHVTIQTRRAWRWATRRSLSDSLCLFIAVDGYEFKSHSGKHYYIWMEEDEEFIKKLMTMLSGGRELKLKSNNGQTIRVTLDGSSNNET
jgi:undecaprenyl pyrophosphate synthase